MRRFSSCHYSLCITLSLEKYVVRDLGIQLSYGRGRMWSQHWKSQEFGSARLYALNWSPHLGYVYMSHFRRFSSHISSLSEGGTPANATSILPAMLGVGLVPIQRPSATKPKLHILHNSTGAATQILTVHSMSQKASRSIQFPLSSIMLQT
jgi:hypothetical protein